MAAISDPFPLDYLEHKILDTMALKLKKYNPGFLSDDELIQSFCVRTNEFDSIVETLHENTGNSNQHILVIGPRGSGKTTLLLRVVIEIRRDAAMSSHIFPIVFAEESYEVSTCGEFWLECLDRLATQVSDKEEQENIRRTWEELQSIRDDQALEERCLGALLDFADREGKRLLLVVENLNMIFRDAADENTGWRLRKTLQTEPRIMLLASATSRFEEIDNPKQALYDLFRILTLRPLSSSECATLWETVSGQAPVMGKIRSLEILTGRNPRLLAIIAGFGAALSFRALMQDLFQMIDEHTEYFRSHIEALSAAQERRVYLALAKLWKPATTREIANLARLDTSQCSALLQRLIERGVVEEKGGTPRRKRYYLTERLYNIYYLLRNGESRKLVQALIQFMVAFYSDDELEEILETAKNEIDKMIFNHSNSFNNAYDQFIQSMTEHQYYDSYEAEQQMLEWINQAKNMASLKNYDTIIEICEEIEDLYDETVYINDIPNFDKINKYMAVTLLNKGIAFMHLNRLEESINVYTDLIKKFESYEKIEIMIAVAYAFAHKSNLLISLKKMEDVILINDEIIHKFDQNNHPSIIKFPAQAFIHKGVALMQVGKTNEALELYENMIHKFDNYEDDFILGCVAQAWLQKSRILAQFNKLNESLNLCNYILSKFDKNKSLIVLFNIAQVLLHKANLMTKMDNFNEAISISNNLIDTFVNNDRPEIFHIVGMSAINNGFTLWQLIQSVSLNDQKISKQYLEDKDTSNRNVKIILSFISEADDIPPQAIRALLAFSVSLGYESLLSLIEEYALDHVLLPLATAFRQEIGLETEVSEEVFEIAQDIRKGLAGIAR